MWSRAWQTDYKGLDSKNILDPVGRMVFAPTPQFYSTQEPQTLCKGASLGVFQQIFTYKNRQWNWFVVKLLVLSPRAPLASP